MKIPPAIKKLSLFFAALLLMWGVIFCYNRFTDGFSLREITSSLSQQLPSPLFTPEQKESLATILHQPFHYIGKGCQFYAFESEDGRYVLKFFKQKHLRSLTWLRTFPMPAYFQKSCEEKIAKREERVRKLFSSCQLAFERLSEETGILFLHLNRLPFLDLSLMITDKIGLKHMIQLDDYEFVLQKKAVCLEKAFEGLSDEQVRQKVRLLVELVAKRCEKGIADHDRSFAQNVAFCAFEERAVFIDIGQFYLEETIKKPEEKQKELQRRLGNLRFWTARYYPALVSVVDKEIEALIFND